MKHAVVALAAAALLASVPARAGEPSESAPYETKLTCVLYNNLLLSTYGKEGKESDAAKTARASGERWAALALADARGDDAKYGADLAKKVTAFMAELTQADKDEGMAAFSRKLDEMRQVCEPYQQ